MDRIAAFAAEKTPRRVTSLVVFLSLLYVFRDLALLLLFFVAFQRTLGWLSTTLRARTGWGPKTSLLCVVACALGCFGLLGWLGIGKTIRTFAALQETFPERILELREHPLVQRIQEQVGGTDKIVESAKHYASNALATASAVGQFFIHVVIAFILAVVYLLEEEEVHAFWSQIDDRSLFGTLGRWLGHIADAAIVTVQLQLIVALFNTVTTLPVMLVLGMPYVGPLMLLIFVSALIPVIGNLVTGVVLTLLAYQARGWLGVGIFTALTFVLHKIESYYLSPRLTARHVKIPGFLLIVSLLACEHIFGFRGFFLSFPILFVTGRIRSEFRHDDGRA